ncbi:hypothetical protein BDV18DRAFT_155485 [Aspergillus unguis]
MNNDEFRRLLLKNQASKAKSTSANSPTPTGNSRSPQGEGHASHDGSGAGNALGSRMRSSIPMTPRTLTTPNFAAQLSEYRRSEGGMQPPNKKFKSSAAPKGTKLPAGYEDRAAARLQADDEAGSGNEAKLKELETKYKKGLIDEETFTRLRRELGVGGDLGSTHMVKGLDWDLLRRIRAGEDVERKVEDKEEAKNGEDKSDGGAVDRDEGEGEVDVDEEFEKLEEKADMEKALPSAPKEKEKKKGSMAAPPIPAQRKTRDEILKELKASRAAAAAPAEPALGARFKRIGDSKPEKKRFIELDENGLRREVLLITDASGNTKRKTRMLDKPGTKAPTTATTAPAPTAPEKTEKAPAKEAPLGMDVPAEIAARIKAAQAQASQEEDEDDDIFAGVGADYDPLGGAESDSSSDSEEDGEVASKPARASDTTQGEETEPKPSEGTAGAAPPKPRNYFSTSTTATTQEEVDRDRTNPLTKDPTLLAALKRAAALRQAESADGNADIDTQEEGVDKDTLLRRKKFLEEAQRREALDAMDMDYGFGGSRNEDDEDEEAVVLEMEPRGGNKRKRGPKKKKGDKDSAADVLGVLEGRKK